jgi:hypothetical protein
MSSLITTAEQALAAAANDVVKAAKVITSKVLPVLVKIGASASEVEAITGLVDPAAVNIELVAYAVLGAVITAIEGAAAAAASGGLNIALDAALVADIKAIIPAVKAQATVVRAVGA